MNKDYVLYDYKTINVRKESKYKVIDSLSAFGYEVIETKEGAKMITINIKREAGIKNEDKLNQLFDEVFKSFDDISIYEGKKKYSARIISIIIGIIGLLTMGGGMSMFMVNDTKGYQIAGVIIGVIGIIIMLVTDLINKAICEKSSKKYLPMIDEKNKEINDNLKEANRLLKESFE